MYASYLLMGTGDKPRTCANSKRRFKKIIFVAFHSSND